MMAARRSTLFWLVTGVLLLLPAHLGAQERTLEELKGKGIWVAGSDAAAGED
ncbi:MAG: hypothetical protein HYY85_14600 [Deltaproteobacteria bacterium]|nr:hypothetical protein [Deltaproteobacteria bacterium]